MMEELLKMPVIGIVRNMAMEDFTEILPVYIQSGLTSIEVTLNTPNAKKMIEYANRQYGNDLVVGAGTICNEADLHKALDAGAKFIVTPITVIPVIEQCTKRSIPVFPGAYTATEIYNAWKAGGSMIKVFPAGSAGPRYIKEIKGPLNQVKLMPTGGVDLSNIRDFFNAGASAVGIGGRLFDPGLTKEKKWDLLLQHFSAYVKAVQELNIPIP